MTDKELDELEALLIERAENLNDPEAYHGDIAEVMLKSADALSTLRKEKAELEDEIERLEADLLRARRHRYIDDKDMWWECFSAGWYAYSNEHERTNDDGSVSYELTPAAAWMRFVGAAYARAALEKESAE